MSKYFNKLNYILIFILFAAFFLRVFQLSYGYPLYFVSDETPNILASLKMIGSYSLRVATPGYYYPALTSYIFLSFLLLFLIFSRISGFFGGIEAMKEAVFLNFGIFIPVARFAVVIFGVLSVYLVYKICEELFKSKPPHKHISVNDINNKQNELLIRHSKTVLSKNFLCEGKKIGLIAAWFLAISFMHVYNSHFAQTWVLQTFFIYLTMYFAVKFYNKENLRPKHYILSGLAVGAAFGINTVGVFSYFFIVLTHFLKNRHQGFAPSPEIDISVSKANFVKNFAIKIKNIFTKNNLGNKKDRKICYINFGAGFVKTFIKNKNFWIFNLTLLLTMVFIYYLNPYGLQNHINRITDTKTPAEFGGAGYSSYKPFSPVFFEVLWFYVKVIFSQETIFMVLGISGAFYVWLKNRTAFYFIVPWIIIYFIIISPLTGATGRYILPIVPALVMLSAYFVNYILEKFSYKIFILAVFLISLFSLIPSILFNLKLMREDTQVLAYNWVLENIPSGSKIQNEYLGESFPFIENKDTITMIQNFRPELMSTKRKYLLNLSDEKYPKPNYLMADYRELSEKTKNFDYIILGHYKKEELNNQKKSLSKKTELVKYFYPVGGSDLNINFPSRHFPPTDDLNYSPLYLFEKADFNGPYIEIYKIKN